jgi:hypothetical protein
MKVAGEEKGGRNRAAPLAMLAGADIQTAETPNATTQLSIQRRPRDAPAAGDSKMAFARSNRPTRMMVSGFQNG